MGGTCPKLVGKSRSGMVACYAYSDYVSTCREFLELTDGVEVPTILVLGRRYLVIEVLPSRALVRIELGELSRKVMESVVLLLKSFRRG